MHRFALLYVDDEESNLRIFKDAFRRKYTIHTAISASEGKKILKSNKIDLVISDQRMPEMTGVEFLSYTLENYPEPNRILITGYTDVDAIENSINHARIFQYIQKPWSKEKLEIIIDDALNLYHLEYVNKKQKQELKVTNKELVESEQKLKEKVRELHCLYDISEIIETPNLSLDDIFERIVNILPDLCQFAEVVAAKIFFENREYTVKSFKETKIKITETILLNGENRGFIELFYSEDTNNRNGGDWASEGKLLLIEIAKRLVNITEIKELESTLNNLIDSQEALIKLRTSELSSTNKILSNEIFEGKIKENTLLKQKNQLQELNASKDKFFKIIAHDLKGPLSSIMSLASLIFNDYNKFNDEERKRFINEIIKSLNRTYNLLENLLEWALVQSGGIDFLPKQFNLNQLVVEEIDNMNERAAQKNIKIVDQLEPKQIIVADKNMISTVIRNLLANGIKYTNENGTIKVFSSENLDSENRKTIQISVSDDGVGIPQKKIATLFEIGNNISTLGTNDEKGTGLGLVLCKDFIEKHKGKIWVESEEGKGSVFSFSIEGF
jgi:signal transduction histidine kinase/FixJ family two-component response regulator